MLVYLLFIIPFFLLGLFVQRRLQSTFARQAVVPTPSGLTGAEVARRILDANGLRDVEIRPARGGPLSDHYDPRSRSVNLSQSVYGQASIAATAVAAHEVGHALQHARSWNAFRVRSAMFPAVSLASRFWMFPLIGGMMLRSVGLFGLGVALYAVVVLFQLVTLPVELNASSRAHDQLGELGLLTSGEDDGSRAVLRAAAMTYVAGALASLGQLAFFAMQMTSRR